MKKKIKSIIASIKQSNKNNLITTLIFCVLILALSIASIVNPVKLYSETEKRNLAQKPTFTFDALFDGSYTADYEEFITDQFVARDAWISLKTLAERTLGKKDSGGVYFGKDGYLIEKHEVNSEQLEKNIGFIEEFLEKYSDEYNVKVLIAPTASLTLSDKLPAFAPVWDQDGLLDRLSELGNFVDCRDVLNEHKNEYIYYRTDHHWTTLGAYYAYTELCTSLGIEPYALEDFNKRALSDEFIGTLVSKVNIKTDYDELFTLEPHDLTVSVKYNMDPSTLTDTMYEESYLAKQDKYSVFFNGNQPIVEITTSTKNGKTLLLVKDSYSHCVVPMLSAHYENIILMDMRAYTGGVSALLSTLGAQNISVDDIVVFYNAENFTEDRNLYGLVK